MRDMLLDSGVTQGDETDVQVLKKSMKKGQPGLSFLLDACRSREEAACRSPLPG
ncbi:MAG: hypothetical protein VB142_03965 [Burkholderia sp.]